MKSPNPLTTDEEIEDLEDLIAAGGFGQRGFCETVIPDYIVHSACRLVDLSGVCELLAEWRREDIDARYPGGRPPGGRPAALDDRAVMVLLVTLGLTGDPLLIDKMAGAIENGNRFSASALELIGIKQHPADSTDNWYDRCWRAVQRLLEVIDPFPSPRKWLLTFEDFKKIEEARDPLTMARKVERMDLVCNELLWATWMLLPRDVRRRFKGNVVVDATVVPSHIRRYGDKKAPWSVTHDAGVYQRTAAGEIPKKGQKARIVKAFYGWESHFAVTANNEPGLATKELPHIVVSMTFEIPGARVSENGLEVLRQARRHHPAGVFCGDRAYAAGSKARKLQLPARQLGYKIVTDYKKDQLGYQHTQHGAQLVEGWWYCPSMPGPLVDATKEYRAKVIDKATYEKRIAERRNYEIMPKEAPDDRGYQPMMCPASGPRPTLACSAKPDSEDAVTVKMIVKPLRDKDLICMNKSSVALKPELKAMKFLQDFRFGSPEWRLHYSESRNAVESVNSSAKNQNRTDLGEPHRRRLRGRAANQLLTCVLVVAMNCEKVTEWVRKAVTGEDGVKRTKKSTTPRRRDRDEERATERLGPAHVDIRHVDSP